MKKILLTSALATSLFTQVSVAEIKLGNAGTLSGSVGVASQYVFRGIDFNRDKPAVFGSIEYQTPAFGAIKPYLGIFASQYAVDYEDADRPTDSTASYELDYSVGIRTSLGKLNLDLGYTFFTFEGGRNERDLGTGEYGVKLSYPIDKLTLNANYYQDDTDGFISSRDNNEYYKSVYELGFSYNLGAVNLVALYRDINDLADGYDVALQKNIMGVDAEIKYTNLEGKNIFSGDEEKNLVFAISKSF
jgi:uncharacterized protein (TIGR02001 family)